MIIYGDVIFNGHYFFFSFPYQFKLDIDTSDLYIGCK